MLGMTMMMNSQAAGGGASVDLEPETETLVAAMTPQPDFARQIVINNLIVALKAGGIWTLLDVLWVFAAHAQQPATLNWKAPASFTATPVSSPTFTVDRGFTGNGSSAYLAPGWSPLDGPQYQQDSAHVSGWSLSAGSTSATEPLVGTTTGSLPDILLMPRFTGDLFRMIVNDGTPSGTIASANRDGFFVANRSGAAARQGYRNGAALGSDAVVSTGETLGALTFLRNGAVTFATMQVAHGSAGASLSGPQVTAYYNAQLAYMQAVGAEPITTNFAASQASAGFFGFFDLVTTVPRRLFAGRNSAGTAASNSDWTGYITGTAATLRCGGIVDGAFDVSVDDGAFVNKLKISGTNADAVIQLFTGLADTPHLVRIRPNTGFANFNTWTFETGNMFSATGFAPAVSFPLMGTKWMITDASFPGSQTHSVIARPAGANVTPTNNDVSNQAAQGTGGAIKIRAQCSDIWVFTADTEAYISVDGAAMTQVTLTNLSTFRAWKKIATGLDNTAAHDYLITCGSSTSPITPPLGIMIGGSGSSYSAIPATKKVIQYGDSITATFGNYAGQTAAIGAIYKDGAALGFIGANCGLSGQTSTGLLSSLATIRGYRNIVEDVAIVAIGRNDAAIPQATEESNITAIINALLAAGVPKIIVRGQNFGGTPAVAVGGVANVDQFIINAVTALANANVVYVSPTTWTTITGVAPNNGGGDGTHPFGNTGCGQLAGYETTAYGALGLFP